LSLTFCLILSATIQLSPNYDAPTSHACRLWGAIGEPISSEIVQEDLVSLPNSLKALSVSNRDGWGLAYYNSTLVNETIIHRGILPASEDSTFDEAAGEIADNEPPIAVGHVRTATSGLTDIPDPHPFQRFKNGRWWLFAHNGGMSKSVLIDLIGEEYLNANPPQVGDNSTQWVDSELYFIYVLECIEEQNWNVTRGITEATTTLYQAYPAATMNFLLTNGEQLWGFCKGHSLYYLTALNENASQVTAIASQYPTSTQGNWTMMMDFDLIEASANNSPKIFDVRTISIPEHPNYMLQLVIFFVLSAIIMLFVVILERKRKL
jgi:predicted glutamine amidotransferase